MLLRAYDLTMNKINIEDKLLVFSNFTKLLILYNI